MLQCSRMIFFWKLLPPSPIIHLQGYRTHAHLPSAAARTLVLVTRRPASNAFSEFPDIDNPQVLIKGITAAPRPADGSA